MHTRRAEAVIRTAGTLALTVALAVVLLLAAPAPAHAQEAVRAAANFTTLVRNVLGAAAVGLAGCALLLGVGGGLFGVPKISLMAKGGFVGAVACGLFNRLFTFFTDTGTYILG